MDVEKEEKEQLRIALQERVDVEKQEKEQLRSVILEMQAKLDLHAANRSAASSSAAQVRARQSKLTLTLLHHNTARRSMWGFSACTKQICKYCLNFVHGASLYDVTMVCKLHSGGLWLYTTPQSWSTASPVKLSCTVVLLCQLCVIGVHSVAQSCRCRLGVGDDTIMQGELTSITEHPKHAWVTKPVSPRGESKMKIHAHIANL